MDDEFEESERKDKGPTWLMVYHPTEEGVALELEEAHTINLTRWKVAL